MGIIETPKFCILDAPIFVFLKRNHGRSKKAPIFVLLLSTEHIKKSVQFSINADNGETSLFFLILLNFKILNEDG